MAEAFNLDHSFSSYSEDMDLEQSQDHRLTQPYGDDLDLFDGDEKFDEILSQMHIPDAGMDIPDADMDLPDADMDLPDDILSQIDIPDADMDIPDVIMERPNARFVQINNDEVDRFIDEQKSGSTKRKTDAHIKLLKSFAELQGEVRKAHKIPPAELDDLLSLFFISVRKVDGGNFEPCTLKSIQSSLERYLKENRYGYSIVSGEEFFRSREAIRSKCRELKKTGKGNKPNRKRAPTENEIAMMWSSGALGSGSPESLQYTMWWIINTRFGKRVNKENHAIRWGDVGLNTNSMGTKYLTLNERETKTRQGDAVADVKGPINVYADVDQPEYCPIRHYELFKQRRPQDMLTSDARFYLQPKKFMSEEAAKKEAIWYKSQPHGQNSLHKYMRLITEKAGLSDDVRLSNMSARKHLVTACKKGGVPDSTTMKITGHKRVESLNSYADLAEEEEMAIGEVLGRPSIRNYQSALQQQVSSTHQMLTSTKGVHPRQNLPPSAPATGSYVFQNCTITNLNMPGQD